MSVDFASTNRLLNSSDVAVGIARGKRARGVIFSNSVNGASRPVVHSPRCVASTACIVARDACNSHDRNRELSCVSRLIPVLSHAFTHNNGMIVPSFTINEARRLLCFVERVGRRHVLGGCGSFPMCISDPLTIRTAGIFYSDCSSFSSRTTSLVRGNVGPVTFPGLCISIADRRSGTVGSSPTPGIVVSTDKVYRTNEVHRRLGRGL